MPGTVLHPDLAERATTADLDAAGLELRPPSRYATGLGMASAFALLVIGAGFYRDGGADGTLQRAAWDIAVTGGALADLREWAFAHWYDGDPAVARASALLVHGQASDPYALAIAGLADIALSAPQVGEGRIEAAVRAAREARWTDEDVAALVEWVGSERR